MGIPSPREHPFGTLGSTIAKDAQLRDLDAKVIITSHNSRPGLGKTTLAIKLARSLDPYGWRAEEKAVMNAAEYHDRYAEVSPGSVILFDEVEGEADSRRSMSNKNVDLSKAWAMNRYRNVITICTLPSVSMLDKRLEEMSDYWINVIDRGVAHPYNIYVNDFNGNIIKSRLDENAVIHYTDLPKGDEDYEYLKEMKASLRDKEDKRFTTDEVEKRVEKELGDMRIEYRNEWIRALNDNTRLQVKEIANLPNVEISRSRVSHIINETNR